MMTNPFQVHYTPPIAIKIMNLQPTCQWDYESVVIFGSFRVGLCGESKGGRIGFNKKVSFVAVIFGSLGTLIKHRVVREVSG